jgi:hypothetical protein
VVGTARGRTPTFSAVVGDLPISIPESAKIIGRPGSRSLNPLSREGWRKSLGRPRRPFVGLCGAVTGQRDQVISIPAEGRKTCR